MASITSQKIHRELMSLILRQNGAYTRTWIGGLRYLKVCVIRALIYYSHVVIRVINDFMFFRPVVLSGWMDPAGRMLIGWQGSPTTHQIWRTVWKYLPSVGLKAHY